MRRRGEFAAGESRDVIAEIPAQQEVFVQTVLHAAAHVCNELPLIASVKSGYLGERLGKRLRASNEKALAPAPTAAKGWNLALLVFAMEEKIVGDGMRLPWISARIPLYLR